MSPELLLLSNLCIAVEASVRHTFSHFKARRLWPRSTGENVCQNQLVCPQRTRDKHKDFLCDWAGGVVQGPFYTLYQVNVLLPVPPLNEIDYFLFLCVSQLVFATLCHHPDPYEDHALSHSSARQGSLHFYLQLKVIATDFWPVGVNSMGHSAITSNLAVALNVYPSPGCTAHIVIVN